jgi:predicted AAA+ superfamily ATPase
MASTPYRRLATVPKSSFFLFGVRGVGKSTWARMTFPAARRFDLLADDTYQELLARPATFADEIRDLDAGSWVVVDEIQRIPPLLNEVHRAIENRRLRFALLGSSARKLKAAGTNLLAGRAIWKTLYPLVPQELGLDHDLERILRHGSIPLVWNAADPEATLRAYVQLYLREEIRAEALVRNLPGFARFLPIAALFHGQAVNVAGIARDAGAARTTVNGYLEILEDTLMTYRLPAFETKLRVRERKHPKLYWVDPGIVRALKKHVGPVGSEETGPLFEGWVLTVLRAHAEEQDLFEEISYWAPAQARLTEVDFLLRRGREHLAIEVKSASRVAAPLLAGLRAIGELHRLTRRILVYRGTRRLRTPEGIEVLPVQHFLAALEKRSLWP